MGYALENVGRGALAGLGGAAAALVIIAGVAGVLLPGFCANPQDDGSCGTAPAAATLPPEVLEEWGDAVETAAQSAAAIIATPPVPRQELSTESQVLATTFDSLSANSAGPTPRVVRAMPVGPDGKPIMSQPASATIPAPTPAEPASAPVIGDSAPTEAASVTVPPETIEPLPVPAPLTEPAPIPLMKPPGLGQTAATETSADVRTVGGTGVNVRAGPSSSEARLFALAPGETVRVLEEQGGWIKVADDGGREGWVDIDYMR